MEVNNYSIYCCNMCSLRGLTPWFQVCIVPEGGRNHLDPLASPAIWNWMGLTRKFTLVVNQSGMFPNDQFDALGFCQLNFYSGMTSAYVRMPNDIEWRTKGLITIRFHAWPLDVRLCALWTMLYWRDNGRISAAAEGQVRKRVRMRRPCYPAGSLRTAHTPAAYGQISSRRDELGIADEFICVGVACATGQRSRSGGRCAGCKCCEVHLCRTSWRRWGGLGGWFRWQCRSSVNWTTSASMSTRLGRER